MNSFFAFLRSKKFPSASVIWTLGEPPFSFSKAGALACCVLALVCAFVFLVRLNNTTLVSVPARGGALTLGVIGAPHEGTALPPATDTDRMIAALTAGPFRFASSHTSNGSIDMVTLKRNRHASSSALLDRVVVRIYATQDDLAAALARGDIDATFALEHPEVQRGVTITPIATATTVSLMRLPSDTTFASTPFASVLSKFIAGNATLEEVHGTLLALNKIGYVQKGGVLMHGASAVQFSIASENDRESLAAAETLAHTLQTLGIYTTIHAYNHGTFWSGVAAQSYGLVLMESTNGSTPLGYTPLFALYTKTISLVSTTRAHLAVPAWIRDYTQLFTQSEKWYVREDRLWKWLAPKQ